MTTLRALLGLALALSAGGAAAVSPPVVSWRDAGAQVGQVVTVEGDVQSARIEGDTYVLEFAAGDPAAFRAVLLLPLFASAPPRPERVYQGRRVRVSGRVQQFRGRPEMVLRSADQIELMDEPGAPAAPETPAALPKPAPPPPAGREDVRRTQVDAAPCERARARWRDAAAEVGARAAVLERCLSATRYRCDAEGAALAPAVATLQSIEQQVEATCR